MDLLSRVGALLRVFTPLGGPRALRRWAVASLVANIVIVVTGALVRLTGSGLGCPTWPRCSDTSYVTHPALGIHGAIEFGNRLLTFVLVIIAAATWVSALLHRDAPRAGETVGRARRDHRWLAGVMLLGIPAQAIIGGITVLTGLNPFIVGVHLMVSMILIALSVWLVRRTRSLTGRPVSPLAAALARVTLVAMFIAVALGTLVTGSGPHSGDEFVGRTGFDGAFVTHVHAAAVYVTVALTLACLILLRNRAAALLLGVEVLQAAIGLAQYHLGLPIGLVLLHLLGASLSIAAAANLALSVRRRAETPVAHPAAAVDLEPAAQ